jgi:hypothetical protein
MRLSALTRSSANCAVFGFGLVALRFQCLARSDGFHGAALLHDQFVALLGQFQLRFEMGNAVAKFHFHDFFANIRRLLN